MRGSIYYQTSQLADCVFIQGVFKSERKNPDSFNYNTVASFQTMETYRRVWNNLGLYIKEEFGIKNFEHITAAHIESYMMQKIDIAPSQQYLEKISSAIGKLECALNYFSEYVSESFVVYDFSIRTEILQKLKKDGLLYDGYHNRAYQNPEAVIENLKNIKHKIAATIQLTSGARFEGVGLIRKRQIKELTTDIVSKREVTPIVTKEKGGNIGEILVSTELVEHLQSDMLKSGGVFHINYQAYLADIRQSCQSLNIRTEGSHGFRWNFSQNRMRAYQEAGYSYQDALQNVSYEIKHRRVSISEHYHGIQPAR